MKFDQPIKLYANCLPVKGAGRGAVCDLQRELYILVPNDLIDLLTTMDGCTAEQLLECSAPGQVAVLTEWLQFLAEQEIIYNCPAELKDQFPALPLHFHHPGQITNASLWLNDHQLPAQHGLVAQLEELGCYSVSLTFLKADDMDELRTTLSLFDDSSIRQLEVHLPSSDHTDDSAFERLVNDYPRIKTLFLYRKQENRISRLADDNGFGNIVFSTAELTMHTCGIVSPYYFSINVLHFTESQQYNTCLNRKIAIDAEGNIRNCPSMQRSYGHIGDLPLKEAIAQPGFQDLWTLHKGRVNVCRDCEFRHVCTDCRAFLDDPDDLCSKPLKCGYDPYTCRWEEWSTHPLKQKAIRHYESLPLG